MIPWLLIYFNRAFYVMMFVPYNAICVSLCMQDTETYLFIYLLLHFLLVQLIFAVFTKFCC